MNIKKTKLVIALTGALFLSLPASQAFAHKEHCEIKETQLGDTMKYMKSELRAYVKGFKKGDSQKMQKHLDELLKLSVIANKHSPAKIMMMDHDGMKNMASDAMSSMDHSNMNADAMSAMDHSNMNADAMSAMDHSNMNADAMRAMDHSNMNADAMSVMDHSNMDHSNMNHSKMQMSSADHDMPSMQGMSADQHHQHMRFMESMTGLQNMFKGLDNAKNDSEIKNILAEIKKHSKKSHQQFRQNC